MTVPVDLCSCAFLGNAATVDFPLPFPILAAAHLVITKKLSGGSAVLQVLGVDYVVTGALNASIVTMTVAPQAASTLAISRVVPLTQEVNLLTAGAMSPSTFTEMADKIMMVAQQLEARIAALEALGSLVSLEDVDAEAVNITFTTNINDVALTFVGGAVNVAIPVGFACTGVLVDKVVGGVGGQEAVQVRDWSVAANTLTLGFVTGLQPGTPYTITLLLLALVPA